MDERMTEQKNILRVPEDETLRNLLRKEAARLVEEKKLLPPASMEILRSAASELIGRFALPEEFTDFTIVLIGNETWRNIISAIPFNRRLLLLPQCLRDSSLCKGKLDEFGLICTGCKNCLINDILGEAEALGYTTLVAEGTTVTMNLIEERSVEAVIGLSCMSVLRQSFAQVSKAVIPAIGIPLLDDGCKNTKVDFKWLMDEIRTNSSKDEIEIFSLPALYSKVKGYFSEQSIRNFFPGSGIVDSLAGEMISAGGKRMRPLLTAVCFTAYSGNDDENILSQLSMIIECFHKASLIHDDIEDNSDHRYNKDTLHKIYGIPAAINVGDYLIGKGYQILSRLPVGNDIIAACLQIISQSHINLTRGQGDDLKQNPLDIDFTTGKALAIDRLKTCEAVKIALLVGAITGGAPENEISMLENFADSFGIAYQIRDDLDEFYDKNEGEKINDFPFLIALLNEYLNAKRNNDRLHSGRQINIDEVRSEIKKFKIDEQAEEIYQSYIKKCYATIDRLKNMGLRLNLYRIMGEVFKTTNTDGRNGTNPTI